MEIMKLDRLETHDRLIHFAKQNFDIGECCQDLIDKKPFGERAFYIYAHTRTDDDGTTKRMIWQPRLTKPKAEPNSMLFKAYPGQDTVKIIWILPARELWEQFTKGQMMHNKTILDSIWAYIHKRRQLEEREEDDLNDEQIDAIYRQIAAMGRERAAEATFCRQNLS